MFVSVVKKMIQAIILSDDDTPPNELVYDKWRHGVTICFSVLNNPLNRLTRSAALRETKGCTLHKQIKRDRKRQKKDAADSANDMTE